MLEARDINLFCTYRGKVFEGRNQGPNNDRTVVSRNSKTGNIMYDSDIYGNYDHMEKSDESRMLPVVSLQAFLEWADREVTDSECAMYYPAKERAES